MQSADYKGKLPVIPLAKDMCYCRRAGDANNIIHFEARRTQAQYPSVVA